jgi:hypothetical protein
MPLQVSAGGAHTPHEHTALQVRVPIVPHAVAHASLLARQQAKPSSQVVSQSSSTPLQSSGAPE